MIYFYFTLSVLLLIGCESKPIAPRKVVYAVDCGGISDQRTSTGVLF